jgi:hypothetical protein
MPWLSEGWIMPAAQDSCPALAFIIAVERPNEPDASRDGQPITVKGFVCGAEHAPPPRSRTSRE